LKVPVMAHPLVGFVSVPPILGWAFITDIAKVLRKNGCRVCFIQPESPERLATQKSFYVATFREAGLLKLILMPIGKASPLLFATLTSALNYKAYRKLLGLIKRIDVLICLNSNYFFPAAVVAKLAKKPLILLFGDILFVKYWRARESKQLKVNLLILYALLAVEKMFVGLADKVVTLSSNDAAVIESWGTHRAKIEVIPLSIDLERVEKREISRDHPERVFSQLQALKASGTRIVVFHGLLSYWPNEFACRFIVDELAPRIYRKYSDVVFVIIGSHPPKDLVEKSGKTIFTGYVRNLFSYINLADVAIAPLTSGSGVKNKILEYFALSKPVVTTTLGVEGLGVKDMVHCSVVKNLDAFPERLVFILEHPEIALEMGRKARKYVENKHSVRNYKRYLDLTHESWTQIKSRGLRKPHVYPCVRT